MKNLITILCLCLFWFSCDNLLNSEEDQTEIFTTTTTLTIENTYYNTSGHSIMSTLVIPQINQTVIDDGFISVDITWDDGESWYGLPLVFYTDDDETSEDNIDSIIDCYYSSSIGEVSIFWDSSIEFTMDDWINRSDLWSTKYKITVINN